MVEERSDLRRDELEYSHDGIECVWVFELYLIDFISLYKAVCKEIHDNLDVEILSTEEKFAGTKKIEDTKFKEVLTAVAKALEDFDSESAANSFEELKEYSLEDEIKRKIIQANEHLDGFEYDQALDIINDLLKD